MVSRAAWRLVSSVGGIVLGSRFAGGSAMVTGCWKSRREPKAVFPTTQTPQREHRITNAESRDSRYGH